jgi:hypothetical protein
VSGDCACRTIDLVLRVSVRLQGSVDFRLHSQCNIQAGSPGQWTRRKGAPRASCCCQPLAVQRDPSASRCLSSERLPCSSRSGEPVIVGSPRRAHTTTVALLAFRPQPHGPPAPKGSPGHGSMPQRAWRCNAATGATVARHRSRVPGVSRTYRSQSVKHVPVPHSRGLESRRQNVGSSADAEVVCANAHHRKSPYAGKKWCPRAGSNSRHQV